MLLPQVLLTDDLLMSSGVSPVASAKASCTCCTTSLGWSPTCTSMVRRPVSWLTSSWTFAPAPSRPFSSSKARASSSEKVSEGTSHTTPPLKSMLEVEPAEHQRSDADEQHQRRQRRDPASDARRSRWQFRRGKADRGGRGERCRCGVDDAAGCRTLDGRVVDDRLVHAAPPAVDTSTPITLRRSIHLVRASSNTVGRVKKYDTSRSHAWRDRGRRRSREPRRP